jgi:putative ABC transport system ATP-binding protein
LVLADEPTGNLDSAAGEKVLDLLTQLARQRRAALILATHDPEIGGRAPHRLHIRDGRMQQH